MEQHKIFKFKRRCRLPSCRKKFETNREWQHFHHTDCQKEWQRLLRRSHDEVIVEMMLIKEEVKKIKKEIKQFQQTNLCQRNDRKEL